MSAELVPESPAYATESERHVGEILVRDLPTGSVVFANLALTGDDRDHELDFVALVPGAPIVVIEVKGGGVGVEHGRFVMRHQGKVRETRPAGQLREGAYVLRDYIENDERWHRQRVRVEHLLVTPYTDWGEDFAMPDLSRRQVVGEREMPRLGHIVTSLGEWQRGSGRTLVDDDLPLIRVILRGRAYLGAWVEDDADERGARADRLTAEQLMLLQVTRLLPRVEVRGCAGSGKTVLALAQAKQLTRGQGDRPPQRVALLCYSIGLAEHFKRETARVGRRHRPAFVGTWEELGKRWGAPEGDRDDSDFWENRLPARMADLARGLAWEDKYDAIIVDEAQDFADSWWEALRSALRDEETSGLYVYSDEQQRVFARFGRPPLGLVPLMLDHNLRNTRQIAEVFRPLAPTGMEMLGGEGAPVEVVPTRAEEALGAADDAVEALLEEGWEPKSVMMLTTGSRHPVQKERQETYGQRGYWETFWEEDDVFYGHVLGCKGMERRAVVLCLNSHQPHPRDREKLYVGLSRATDRLVVVGDPEFVRTVGGDEVARRLGVRD